MTRIRRFLPGKTLGILGSGQLGRMLALSARQHGYRVVVFSSEAGSPAGQVADEEIVARYEDLAAVGRFAGRCDVITFEFENVPAITAKAAREGALVRPDPEVLFTAQNRVREKTEMASAGFATTPFHPIRSIADIPLAVAAVGLPGVLKTAQSGYDGKGQQKVSTVEDLSGAFETFGFKECILEAFVAFERELSVVVARDVAGNIADYGVFENVHVDHILDLSISPAPIEASVQREAIRFAHALAEQLELVGVICIELFMTLEGGLLFNELAPRPHNSGHLTIEGFVSSQFEQQLRTVCGLPLGSTERRAPAAAMGNILGDLWTYDLDGAVIGEPNWPAALALPGVHLHLYGKRVPRPGRKMGHLTALGATPETARTRVRVARSSLVASA